MNPLDQNVGLYLPSHSKTPPVLRNIKEGKDSGKDPGSCILALISSGNWLLELGKALPGQCIHNSWFNLGWAYFKGTINHYTYTPRVFQRKYWAGRYSGRSCSDSSQGYTKRSPLSIYEANWSQIGFLSSTFLNIVKTTFHHLVPRAWVSSYKELINQSFFLSVYDFRGVSGGEKFMFLST